ncbi:hypothetical protein NX059_003005 [Plenodomus lindquistii]|nr:hypothetical protein NX059_003005 [Plenodomus lindquistii]
MDPSVVYENGTYWRFSTAGNIAIASAPALEGPWEYRGALLDNGTEIFVNAPSVTKINDTFYCHYAVSTMGSKASQIGVATSKSLEPGTWQDHGSINIPYDPEYNRIDPYIYQETPDSSIYLTFGSYWGGIYQGKLSGSDQLIRLSGNPTSFHSIVRNSTHLYPAVVEGATMYKHDDGKYYIFFSVGECCRTLSSGLADIEDVYRVVVCRSDFVHGPFVDKDEKDCMRGGGTTILASHGEIYAPGGQHVMLHPENHRPVMSYHYRKFSDSSKVVYSC